MKNKNGQVRLGIQFFLASEAFFFVALIIAFLYYRNFSEGWVNSTQYLDATKTGIFTFLLLSSSLSITWAAKGIAQQKRTKTISGLVLTLVLGIVFMIGQGLEYAKLIQSEMTISQNIFGSAFFTLTGFHGLHVLVGLVILSIMLWLAFTGRLNKSTSSAFTATEWYWHFVDAVWIVVFFIVYLMPIL